MIDLLTRSYEKLGQREQLEFSLWATGGFITMIIKLRHASLKKIKIWGLGKAS